MTATRDQIVAEARTWLETPFHHQGRVKCVGVDCAGVPVMVAKALGLDWADAKGYARMPSNGVFGKVVWSVLKRITLDQVKAGDLMTFAWRGEEHHIAIVSQIEPIRLIHAWQEIGRVVENDLDETWKARLRGCGRWPQLDD